MRFLPVFLLSLSVVIPVACSESATDASVARATEQGSSPQVAAPTEPGPAPASEGPERDEAGAGPPPDEPSAQAQRSGAPPTRLSDHRLAYLERAADEMRRLERAIGEIGQTRTGSGALAAAALAAHGRDPWKDPAAAWTRRALELCEGEWHKLDCELVMMNLQRIVLQFPEGLPEPLLGRARQAASQPAPPPEPSLIRDPWSFRRTENQQIGLTARALGAHAVAGTGASPAGRAWSRYAEAFLRAHDRDGWYEGDSPGYMATSITALLHLADHAPDPRVRDLAARQLHLLFVQWAENQVEGTPAGPRSRTYVHWAQGVRNTPWRAWAWYAAGLGDPGKIPLGDWPEIATAGYDFPEPIVTLLRSARDDGPYEIHGRREIDMAHRRDLRTATYSWVTPDYVLSAAQGVDGRALGVSGGQEIQVTLFAEGPEFAPLYLWSRTQETRRQRWRSRAGQEKGVARRNLAAAWMGTPAEPGHAWLSAPWSRPEPVGDGVLVSRYGDTFVALVTAGGWEVAPAGKRFPGYYAGQAFAGSWVAVPRDQPAAMGLEVARASELTGEEGPWAAWKDWASLLEMEVAPAGGGSGRTQRGEEARRPPGAGGGQDPGRPAVPRDPVLTFRSSSGTELVFRPGISASVDGRPMEPGAWPLHRSPHLERQPTGAWQFRGAGEAYRFPPLDPEPGSAESE